MINFAYQACYKKIENLLQPLKTSYLYDVKPSKPQIGMYTMEIALSPDLLKYTFPRTLHKYAYRTKDSARLPKQRPSIVSAEATFMVE